MRSVADVIEAEQVTHFVPSDRSHFIASQRPSIDLVQRQFDGAADDPAVLIVRPVRAPGHSLGEAIHPGDADLRPCGVEREGEQQRNPGIAPRGKGLVHETNVGTVEPRQRGRLHPDPHRLAGATLPTVVPAVALIEQFGEVCPLQSRVEREADAVGVTLGRLTARRLK